ncbi:MAG: PAS domain-containing protein [Spirochaetota bacterium]
MDNRLAAHETNVLRAVLSTIDEVIVTVDPETRSVIQCNEAMRRVFGCEPEEVIGRNTAMLHIDAKHHAEFGRRSEEALDREGRFTTEFPMRRRDGAAFPAEISVVAIKARDTWVSGVVSVIRDITRRRKDDELRRRNQHRLRLLTEQLPAVLWTTDDDLRITSILGRDSTRLVAERFASCISRTRAPREQFRRE